MDKEYIGYNEASLILKVTADRVRHIVAAGRLKKYVLADGPGFLRSDVEAYAEQHGRNARKAKTKEPEKPKRVYEYLPGGWKDMVHNSAWPLGMVCTECGTIEHVETWLGLARSGRLEAILPSCGHSWDCYQPKRLPL